MSKLKTQIRNYGKSSLNEKTCPDNPLELFSNWLQHAFEHEPFEANAMTLATINKKGQPTARIVLLKDVSELGFTFFTNYQSDKALDIIDHPQVALVFWWPQSERQVRVEGTVEKTTASESDEYFAIRSRESKLGAYVSPQSRIIPDRNFLDQGFATLQQTYAETNQIPRPEHWGGYRVFPTKIEFWQGGPHRLHDRICYTRHNKHWSFCRLAP